MHPPPPVTIRAGIFYFDVIGVTDAYLRNVAVAKHLADFQRQVRRLPLPLGRDWSTLITVFDNVWARINMTEAAAEHTLLSLAAGTMQAAKDHGFDEFIGVCTIGEHTFDLVDKAVSGDACDIRLQHIDTFSEPHLRAVMVEKWSNIAHKQGSPLSTVPCTWIGKEVLDSEELKSYATDQGLNYRVLKPSVNFSQGVSGLTWPFPLATTFTPIGV